MGYGLYWTVSGLGGCTGHMVCWGQEVIEVKVIFTVAKQLKQSQRKPRKDLVASQLRRSLSLLFFIHSAYRYDLYHMNIISLSSKLDKLCMMNEGHS